MNTHKSRQAKVCECGRKFLTSAKFGNETMCNACYKRHSQEFRDWLDSLTDEEHHAAYLSLCAAVAELGITVGTPNEAPAEVETTDAEQVDAGDQDTIDATFLDLMTGIDL